MTEPNIDPKRIKNRKQGREHALAAYDLMLLSDGTPPWDDGYGADFAEAMLEKLRELLPQRRMSVSEEPKQIPIATLGLFVMPFGEHKGHRLDDVPLAYLDWLCREQEFFYKSLRAYLTHPDLESRRGHA